MPGPLQLTHHHALPRRYLGRDLLSGKDTGGYTAWDLFKFFGMVAGLSFGLAYTYIRYLELFTAVGRPDATPQFKLFVVFFSALPLIMVAIAVLGFMWWAGGALVQYSRWQRTNPVFWQRFWFAVLLFYGVVLLDPLDKIHPMLSRKGLMPALNVLELLEGRVVLYQFQWGYALLWGLFWFLVAAAHYSYLVDGLKELWFYTKRVHRYSSSVLTGFRGTLNVYRSRPETIEYPAQRLPLPERFRGVPQLATAQLTAEQARAIVAADSSRSIALAPGQTTALLIDLGSYSFSPALAALTDDTGAPLLSFGDAWAAPAGRREDLIVPLAAGAAPGRPDSGRMTDEGVRPTGTPEPAS